MKTRSSFPYYMCAFLTGNIMGALFCWSFFRESLAQLFPMWSAGQLSTVFSVHNVVVVVVMLLNGQLLKKIPPRVITLIGGICLLVGFGLFPALPVDNPNLAYIMLIVCFTVIAASASGFCGLIMTAVYPMWVPNHMGLVAGIAVTACNISPLYFSALCGVLIPKIGVLRTVQIIGIIVFVMILITLKWCRFPTKEDNLPAPQVEANVVSAHDYTLPELLKSPLFWCFFIFCSVNRGCGLIMSDLGGTVAAAMGAATILGLVFSPASAVSSLAIGIISDKIGLKKSLFITALCMVACGVFLLLGNMTSAVVLLVAGLIFGGLSYGAQMTLAATATRVFFGNKNYGQAYSFINASIGIGAVCGIAAGFLIDLMHGAFGGVFTFILILALVGTLVTFGLYKFMKEKQ